MQRPFSGEYVIHRTECGTVAIESEASVFSCPACGSSGVVDRGRMRSLEGLITLEGPGHLYICPDCGLHFRRPYPDETALAEAYGAITAEQWSYQEKRVDHALARQAVLEHCRKGKILDIGCFRGDFLSLLPDGLSRFGIEPSPGAAEIARERGVTIIAETVEQVEAAGYAFDVITMLDVAEHLPHPVDALERAVDLLAPGGILIIATGNRDALPWRLLRLDYWYYFPEHVSFFNRRWFDWFSRRVGGEVVSVRKFSHFDAPVRVRFRQLLDIIVYRLANAGRPRSLYDRFIRSIYPFSRVASWDGAPRSTAWRDHMLVVFRKGSVA